MILVLRFPDIAGEDYTIPSSLTLEPGETQRRVLLPIINDRTLEPLRESFTVELTAEGEAVIITLNTATITILDDDGMLLARQLLMFCMHSLQCYTISFCSIKCTA